MRDMTTNEQIKKRLAEEIKTIGLLSAPISSESYDEDLLISGMVDSYGFIEFITFVEIEYTIVITEEMQLDERLRSINGMTDLIDGLKK